LAGKLTGGNAVPENLWERYGPYSRKRKKKRSRFKGGLLKGNSEWFKWKIAIVGGSSFYHPCLEI
jgi:hypothetical protein